MANFLPILAIVKKFRQNSWRAPLVTPRVRSPLLEAYSCGQNKAAIPRNRNASYHTPRRQKFGRVSNNHEGIKQQLFPGERS